MSACSKANQGLTEAVSGAVGSFLLLKLCCEAANIGMPTGTDIAMPAPGPSVETSRNELSVKVECAGMCVGVCMCVTVLKFEQKW